MRIKLFCLWMACGLVWLVAIAACAGAPLVPATPTAAPTQSPVPKPDPAVIINPNTAGAGTQVTVVGSGFPANADVGVYLGLPGAGLGAQAHVQGVADASGNVGLAFALPASWPDGRRITENKLVLTVTTKDQSVRATAELDYVVSLPQPAQPTIAISPSSGGAGTQVTIAASGFPPNASLSVYLGLPNAGVGPQSYVGGVADANGSAVMAIVMPDKWPDGAPIVQDKLAVLAASADFSAKAAAEFGYAAPATSNDYPQSPQDVVRQFLTLLMNDHSGGSSTRYLDSNLQAESNGGRTLLQILGIPNIYQSFTVDAPGAGGGDSVTLQATLDVGTNSQPRLFVLKQEDGQWRISAVAAAESAPPGEPGQITNDFLLSLLQDPTGESSLKYLSRRLVVQVHGGSSVLSLLALQSVYNSFAYELPSPTLVRVTLNYDMGPQARSFQLVQEGGGWKIDTISQ